MPDTNLGWDRLPLEDPEEMVGPPPDRSYQSDLGEDFGLRDTPIPTELPYGQKNEQTRQRLLAGAGQVEDDFYGGKINESTFKDTLAKINRQLQPLEQRRLNSLNQQQQSFTQQALGQTAMEDAVNLARQRNQVGQLPVKAITPDPNQMYVIPDGKGGFTQLTPPAPPEVPEVYGEQATEGQPKDHTLTIQNGQRTQDFFYRDGRMVGRGPQTMADGRPIPQPPPEPELAENDYHNQARKIIGGPPPEFVWFNGRQHSNPAYVAWRRDVRQQATDLAKEHRERLREEEHRRQEEVRTATSERKTVWQNTYDKKLKELQDDADSYTLQDAKGNTKRKLGAGESLPDYLTDREAMENEAEKRADRDYQRAHGSLPESRQKKAKSETSPQPREVHPAEKPVAKVEPLPASKATLADIQAEIERRMRLKKQAAAGAFLGNRSLADGPAIMP